jgi:hypothetical protein
VIKTFKSKRLANFYFDGVKKGLHPEHSRRLERILDSIENATDIRNMRTSKRKPSHPGEILKELYLDAIGISITEFSKTLGVSRKAISAIVNEAYPMSKPFFCLIVPPFSEGVISP